MDKAALCRGAWCKHWTSVAVTKNGPVIRCGKDGELNGRRPVLKTANIPAEPCPFFGEAHRVKEDTE